MNQEPQQLSTNFTPYQKMVVLILALLQFVIVLDFMIIAPIGDVLMKTLNISTEQFGLVVSAYAFSAAISGLAIAGFADRYDRKKMLLVFYSVQECLVPWVYILLQVHRQNSPQFSSPVCCRRR